MSLVKGNLKGLQAKFSPEHNVNQRVAAVSTKSWKKNELIQNKIIRNMTRCLPYSFAGLYLSRHSKDAKATLQNWWLKYTALKLNLYDEKNNEEIQVDQPFADNQTEVKYWVQPLTSIKTEEDIRNVVERVMEMLDD